MLSCDLVYPRGGRLPILNIGDSYFAWRTNFSGDPSRDTFKSADRQATLFITDEMAAKLSDMGWNVRMKVDRDNPDNARPFIKVKMRYPSDPPENPRRSSPEIYHRTSDRDIQMTPDTVGNLDYINVDRVDACIRLWEKDGRKGFAVNRMFVYEQENMYPAWAQVNHGNNAELCEEPEEEF